jgi:hypothetical protein
MDRNTKLNRLIRLINDLNEKSAEDLIEELERRLGSLDRVLPPGEDEIPSPRDVVITRETRHEPSLEEIRSTRKILLRFIRSMEEGSLGNSLSVRFSYRDRAQGCDFGISDPRKRTRILKRLEPEFEKSEWSLSEWSDSGMDSGFELKPLKKD